MEQQVAPTKGRTITSTKPKYIPVFINDNINGNSPRKSMQFAKWVTDLNWRLLLILLSSVFLILLYFSNYGGAGIMDFSPSFVRKPPYSAAAEIRKSELTRSRIAVCLVGGARRFELTGPSIIERVLNEFPNSDLFLNTPLDSKSYKLSLLKFAPRVNSVRIFKPSPIPETESQVRVLTAANSPNGIQGLLQYFNLVEGCLTLIKDYQREKGFTYDWIVRTRVDGYWSAPLGPESFIPGKYVVPPGSSFSGLNDRLGVGDYNTSVVALSRLSLIPTLDKLNYTQLNSETAFKAQLTSHNVSHQTPAQPFCIVTDRKYPFPPGQYDVPVAALSSPGPLSGAKCRPCSPACTGTCVADVMLGLSKGWSWTPWSNGSIQLCNAHSEWEVGWKNIFDTAVGKKLAQSRKRVDTLYVKQCVKDFEQMKKRAAKWDTPPLEQICKLGLMPKR